MHSLLHITASSLALLTAAGLATAQTTSKVVPTMFETIDGNESTIGFVGHDAGRFQQVWNATSVATAVAQLREIAFRADAPLSATKAFNVANVAVELGGTAAQPGALSKTFATNRGKTMTKVFQGTLNVPAYAGGQSVAPFDVKIPLTAPYAYLVSSGNLLMDVTMGSSKGNRTFFSLDATGAGGASYRIGTSGKLGGDNLNFVFSSDEVDLHPAGNFSVSTTTTFKAYPGALLLGGSKTSWSGIKLPFDLGLLGAAGNKLYTSVDFSAPHNFKKTFIGYSSTLQVFIPNNPTLANAEIFTQSLLFDPSANRAGTVTTNAYGIRIAADKNPQLDAIYSADPTAANGSGAFFKPGGAVVRFAGTIN